MLIQGNGKLAPSDFPPPVDSVGEFVGPPTDPEDERIEVGVAIVGGGQAGLACAIRLLQLLEDDPELMEKLGEVPVAVVEKGKVAGAHQLSGAVMNPSSIRQLFPDLSDDDWPNYGPVGKERVYFMLNKKRAVPLVPTPPPFRNHGNYVIALAEFNRWMAEKAEEMGAYILSETSAHKLLVEDGAVVGIRTGDKGRDKEGGEKGNFEPGSDVVAKATVLAEALHQLLVVLEELQEPDRARQPGLSAADDRDADLDALVLGIGDPGDELLGGFYRRRELRRLHTWSHRSVSRPSSP